MPVVTLAIDRNAEVLKGISAFRASKDVTDAML
jgi:hypothetical protein